MGDRLMTLLACALFVSSVSQLVHSIDYCAQAGDNPTKYYAEYPNLTIVENAVSKGAVCLDGTPPAYQFNKGYGEGVNDWTIHLEGGGWCFNDTDCLNRYTTCMGSSTRITKMKNYFGIQSPDQTKNPYFYNWNKIYVRYCDGGSYLADVEEPRVVNGMNLYFRGARVFKAIVDDLLEKGMKDATNILFSGNSAGGLANMLHCDNFRSLVPNVPRVKCLADSAFFIHGKDLPALELREGPVATIVEYHQLAKQLPTSCTSKMDPYLCFFPEYFVGDIQTPLFMVQSAYDKYQIDKRTYLQSCYANISSCTPDQLKDLKDFATTLVETLPKPPSRGLFVDSCRTHDHIIYNGWYPQPTVNNKTPAEAVADWFFDRSSVQEIESTDVSRAC